MSSTQKLKKEFEEFKDKLFILGFITGVVIAIIFWKIMFLIFNL